MLGALLLCTLLSVSVPIASVSADSICRLACCAGHAAHVAGSCMNGSCHAAVRSRKAAYTRRRFTQTSEAFCGLSRRGSLIAIPKIAKIVGRTPPNESSPPKGSAAALIRQSAPDCSGCASGFTNRQRNSAAVTHAERVRPLLDLGLADLCQHLAQTRDGLFRCGTPRGPPV